MKVERLLLLAAVLAIAILGTVMLRGRRATSGNETGVAPVVAAAPSGEMIALRNELQAAREELARLRQEMSGLQSVTHAAAEPIVKRKPRPPEPEPNTLVRDSLQISETPGGIRAEVHFSPTDTNALDQFGLIVRIPKAGGARILGIGPLGAATYKQASQRISDDGCFAAFQGIPVGLETLAFELTVSEPVTASVLATCGVEPFSIPFARSSTP